MFTQEEKQFIFQVFSQLNWKTEQMKEHILANQIIEKVKASIEEKVDTTNIDMVQ